MKPVFYVYETTVLLTWFFYYFLKKDSNTREDKGFAPVSFIPILNIVVLIFTVRDLVVDGADAEKVASIAYFLPVLSLLGLYFLM
jgi:hypothetical protein